MASPSDYDPAPFAALRRALVRRRLQRIDLRLKLELLAIAALITGFLFWQLRLRFAGIAYLGGAAAVARELLLIAAALGIGAAATAAIRFARIVRRGGMGPAWLLLPLPVTAVRRHFAWESRLAAAWVVFPALAATAAAADLLPLTTWAYVAPTLLAAMVGGAFAGTLASGVIASQPDGLWRHLEYGARRQHGGTRHAASWRQAPLPVTLWRKDALLLRRSPALRARLIPALAFAALSAAVWLLPGFGRGGHPVAFALALFAAGAFGEWILALAGRDPFAVLRGLPVDWPALWLSRMVWVIAGVATLLLLHAVAATPLQPPARVFFSVWLVISTLAVMTLAVHYAHTVFPRLDQGQRLYELGLVLAVVGSLLIPLLGWLVLLTALVHSAMRLPRWWSLEDRP